ncbi:MAG TPA: hypothetical protein VMQ83_13920 [Gammaproteobacteria bacterium]|nr:hypothetical protein [Gammaproteobacteria bacterium]
MDPEPATTADLLNAWRDAVRAAELAERLATTAAKAADDADLRALVSTELAELAEQAAAAATRAAARAAAAAADATAVAKALRDDGVADAQRIVEASKANAAEARAAYDGAEAHTP